MPLRDHLSGEIYHMVHINNLYSIFHHGNLLPKTEIDQTKLTYHSIAYESVQGLRDRIFIKDFATNKFHKLHSYVPFYFIPNSPMFFVQKNREFIDQIAFLVINRAILTTPGVLFTDGNAANQQLSQFGKEQVGITPATAYKPCMREYRPNGPHGTNQRLSNIYSDISQLPLLNWYEINGGRRADWEENKRVRSAEALMPYKMSIKTIQYIAVNRKETVNAIIALIGEYCLIKYDIPIIARPDLFNF